MSGPPGVAVAYGYLKRMDLERGEFYTLLMFSITGMMLMAQAADLIVILLVLELVSMSVYVLVAFAHLLGKVRIRSESTSCSDRLPPALSSTASRWSSAPPGAPPW